MNHSFKVGFSFGSTSGIITTLGLMIGLYAGTHSLSAILGGILTIAIADSFSDALGIHISEESENVHTTKEIWESTISTFLFKFIFASSFIVPLLLFPLLSAVLVSIVWGTSLLAFFSYKNAKQNTGNPWHAVSEHLIIMVVVIVITYYAGNWISLSFS